MKRIISLLLAVVMMISMTTTSFAANTGEAYYTVQVEYSDNIGHQEELDVMIQNNNVFVDAKMLAERLGYTFGENDEGAVIYNKDTSNGLPFGITQFKYNSTQVSHMLFNNMIDTYEAPFVSVKNSKGSWIPLEYSLLLINSGMMITDDALLIDIPTKRIIDYYYDIAKNAEKYNFDWADDFGYTETDLKVLGGSSHLINVFNGLLGFDGASWATLFQQFAGSMASYDKKYGENLAMLLCTESDKELQASIEKVKLLNGLLNEEGDLGKILSFTSDMADFEVGTLYKQCEAVLEGIKTGNSSAVDYSRSYQALENALDRQTWFSHTGGNILEVQKGVSSATGKAFKFLDVGMKVAEVVGYTQEFQNQDKFSLAALTCYLDTKDGGLELPEAMKKSMIEYSDALSSNIAEYTTKRFVENVDQWIIDEIPMHEVLGTQAAAVLFAWNIASNTIPFIANGLSGADSFELALYSLVFQGDAFLNYLSKRDSVFADSRKITAENMYDIAQYCYIYLKSCYTTREAAIASLVNKSSSAKEKIQPLIDYQNSINAEIAKIMVELKGANRTNNGCVFGFLPSDNEDYLGKYDDSRFVTWVMAADLVTDAYANDCIYTANIYNYETEKSEKTEITCMYRIPRVNLSSSDVEKINSEIYNSLSPIIEDAVAEIDEYGYPYTSDEVIYDWSVNGDVLSLVIRNSSYPDSSGGYEYMVYNISVSTGNRLSKNELLSVAGVSQENYRDMLWKALGSAYFQGKESYIDQVGYDDFFRTQLENTLSEDNIQSCVPYFNEDGQLCIIGAIYSLAAADFYYHEINLGDFVINPAFSEYMEIQAKAANSDSFVEQYKAILLQHPESTPFSYGSNTSYIDTEYTLYDVDKNGTPELIVREDLSKYYIYSFNGTDVISSDVCYWPYDECLYEYEGNGIVIHDGGMGSMRIENASLYSMVNNKLVWSERLMSTEECSVDELYAFLDSLPPINDFLPITDDSHLSN